MGSPPFAIPEQLTHLIPTYCAELAADIARLRELLTADRESLAEHAHAMGGKCAMFGDIELAEMLYEIEREAPVASARVMGVLATQALARAQSALDSLKAQFPKP